MVTFAEETKMHYPVMTEQQVAARWKVSLKTMWRWQILYDQIYMFIWT
jgi:hypothetical protein